MQTIPELLRAGCRRLLSAPDLEVQAIYCQPLPGGLSGSVLERCSLQVHDGAVDRNLTLIHKRGAVVTGAFLRGAPQREAWVYQQLRPHIPLKLPGIVAVDRNQGDIWMLPFAASKPSNHWSAAWDGSDVERSLTDLARLHQQFWGKTTALAQVPWLAQPIGRDAQALLEDAEAGLQQIITASAYDDELTSERVRVLLAMAQNPKALLDLLHATPLTLLHGDAGFQNIAISTDGGECVWHDWQLTGVGPAALDMVTYLHPWAYPQARPPMSLSEMVDLYLAKLQEEGTSVDRELFLSQLDAALLWRWLAQWAPLLGKYSARLPNTVRHRLYHAFAQLQWPVLARWR